MSRQRIKPALEQAAYLECPHCYGKGKVKSVESMALSFLRKAHAAAARGTAAEIRGGLPLEVAYFLLNRKKHELAQIENDYDVEITVKGKPSYLLNQMELDVVRREKGPESGELHTEEHIPSPPSSPAQVVTETAAAVATEGGTKKRKRRRKKKGHGQEHAAEALAIATPAPVEPGPPAEEEMGDHAAAATSEEPKKKKRRRKRKKKGAETPHILNEQAVTESILALPPQVEAPAPEPPAMEAALEKPKRGGRPRKPAKKPAVNKETKTQVSASEATSAEEPAAVAVEKPKRKRAPRKKKEPETIS
jgi:ribonuclease E